VFTVTATIKPVPTFVKRIQNASIIQSEKAGAFTAWPAAQPIITLERGERLPISLRIRPLDLNQKVQLSSPSETYTVTKETNGSGYMVNTTVEAPAEGLSRVIPLVVKVAGGEDLKLQVTVNVPAESLTLTPRQLDFGEVPLGKLAGGDSVTKRLGIRKQVGTFGIKSLTSTLEFLQVDSQTIIDGSNYLIRVRFDSTKKPKAATYTGTLRIETTDTSQPVVEVPIKLVVTP
jgi:hypothetical protein